ncbi:transcription factor Bmr1 [Amniculicola lignicola CBS 123094]|uniref:Transcription factor Bmr1 n=1 Tax=Amniculicola lignicola CBS 123094 TaxID=1392246 RepID=A0A6A5WJ55_9PLEO|nr:transcription factor Bmr1 [Amniculicola lignicola CBS 123094]
MVFCTYCGQSFTRDEHLERHILTHTNVKPFKCFTCHMSFARRDLLQRHYTVHGRDQNNQEGLPSVGIIPKSAGRTPIACSNCAKTKTKCDKKFPCSRCAARNLRCTLRPTRRASKNVNRVGAPGEGSSGNSSENGNNEAHNVSSGNSPARDTQGPPPPPQANGHTSPPQLQQAPHPATQTPSAPHSRNPSVSQSVQLQNPTPEEKPLGLSASTTPPFFEQSPTNGLAPSLPSVLSPLSTPVNGFVSSTPMSGFEEFSRTGRESTEMEASPHFTIDPWATMPMGRDFDPMGIDPSIMMSMNMDISMGAPQDGILGMIPEMSPPHGYGPVQTPIQTPRMDESFSDLQIGSSASLFYPTNRNHSICDSGVPDLGAIVAAQDGWTVFRCTPTIPSSSCPRTARINLERLELSLKNHKGWGEWRPSWDDTDFHQGGDNIAVVQLHESTRDKLLAITQSFLHKALDIHKDGMTSSPSSGDSPGSSASNFILLPPARVLELFLRSYANSFERFYPMTAGGLLDPNELMTNFNDKASSLLLLMMIAQGAMVIPSIEARWLTGGLTEACRISLFDLIEKNIIMAGDPIVLRAALLFTVQAAWSGDKWQMDIAMGQRGMYFAMLRHSGILEPRHISTSHMNGNPSTDSLWGEWIQQESRSRLIYSWVMVDQDLSLFHDTAPLFSVTEFGAPMPDADLLWHARSAHDWSELFNQVHEFSNGFSAVGSGARPFSLRDLFRHFLDDEIIAQDIALTPLHLRLLLHPLQSLVNQYCQLLSCFSDSMASRSRSRAVTAASTRVRLEEVQALLQRWYDLAERHGKVNPICPMMQGNLVMFHLISLNAVTNFPEIERLARREGFDGSYQQMLYMHKKCISDVQEAIFHSGQILRLIRTMSRSVRPPWWPAAIYRVALILWTESLTHNEQQPQMSPNGQGHFQPSGVNFAIDNLPAEHPVIARYLTRREGIPTLTKRDGSSIQITNAFHTLEHCVEVLDEGTATRFSDGIRSKLEKLSRG